MRWQGAGALARITKGRGESSASMSRSRGAALTAIFSFGGRNPEGTTRATGTAATGDALIGACDSRGNGATESAAVRAVACGCRRDWPSEPEGVGRNHRDRFQVHPRAAFDWRVGVSHAAVFVNVLL